VNPDSDLYRAHPDWVLGVDGVEPIPSRNQLTLDLTRKEVCDYLFERITALVSEYAIDYIKWDMNRDTHFPGSEGRAVMNRQTHALYALFERIRTTHPDLEIESCASGGGRADFGILRHADRVWTSDNNDARARQKIIHGASHFLPLRVLGNHVGPATCHVTGRTFTMAFRVASSLLGHMGLELDLRKESEADLETLKAGIALHKQHRSLIHNGRFVRLTCDASINAMGCVAEDCSEALFSYAKLEEETATLPSRLRFAHLNPDSHYRLRIVWPLTNPTISSPSIIEAAELFKQGALFNGAVLMQHGIQPPLIHPDTALIYHLQAER
ncbi:MAG: alpha-galactosidase, partial [Marinomonas sp.]